MFVASFFFGLHHVTVRVVKFGNDRVSHGDHVFFVFEHEGEVNLVARTPHAPFAVNEAFYSLLHDFTTHVEIAV